MSNNEAPYAAEKEGLYKQVVDNEVQPALGCTEPGAVAYAASIVADMLAVDGERPSLDDVKKILVIVDPGTLKNGATVAIPGVNNGKGFASAAALGFCEGDPSQLLQSLSGITEAGIQAASCAECGNKIIVKRDKKKKVFFVEITAEMNDGRHARVVLEGGHTSVVRRELNGMAVEEEGVSTHSDGETGLKHSYRDVMRNMSMQDLINMAAGIDEEDRAHIRVGVEMNLELANAGIGLDAPAVILRGIEAELFANCLATRLQIAAMQATAARMGGAPHPAMSSGGSGNQGILATLIPHIYGKERGIDDRTIEESIALSNLVNSYCKAFTGELAPVCGCSIAAGLGAAAAIAYMHGKSLETITRAINYVVATISGIACDGAHKSCALKVGISVRAVMEAVSAAINVPTMDLGKEGIIGGTVEETIQNVAKLAMEGMENADGIMISMIEGNVASGVKMVCPVVAKDSVLCTVVKS